MSRCTTPTLLPMTTRVSLSLAETKASGPFAGDHCNGHGLEWGEYGSVFFFDLNQKKKKFWFVKILKNNHQRKIQKISGFSRKCIEKWNKNRFWDVKYAKFSPAARKNGLFQRHFDSKPVQNGQNRPRRGRKFLGVDFFLIREKQIKKHWYGCIHATSEEGTGEGSKQQAKKQTIPITQQAGSKSSGFHSVLMRMISGCISLP